MSPVSVLCFMHVSKSRDYLNMLKGSILFETYSTEIFYHLWRTTHSKFYIRLLAEIFLKGFSGIPHSLGIRC